MGRLGGNIMRVISRKGFTGIKLLIGDLPSPHMDYLIKSLE